MAFSSWPGSILAFHGSSVMLELHGDALAQRVPQQVGKIGHQARHVGRLRRERLAARKGQQLLGQARAPVGRRCRGVEARQHRRVGVHRALHQVEVRLDDLEDVVEVVRHAAGELAGRLHLLALPQRHLVAQLLGDIDEANDRAAARHLAARNLVVATVIRGAHRQRAAGRLDAELQRFEQRAHRRQAIRQQLIARQRRLLGGIPARKADERLVPGDDLAVGIDHEDRVLQAFQRRLQQPRPITQLALRVFQAAGAANDDVHADDEAQERAGHDQQAGDVGLILLRAQHGQPARQQEPLPLDEGVGDLPELIAGRAARSGALQGQRRVAAVELIGRDRAVELVQLLVGGGAEFPDLLHRVGIAGGRRLELAQLGLDAQARALVGLQIGDLAAQQVGALADLRVLQRDDRLAHQAPGSRSCRSPGAAGGRPSSNGRWPAWRRCRSARRSSVRR